MDKIKNDFKQCILKGKSGISFLFLIALLLFLAVFMFFMSYTTSPFYPDNYGLDSAFFRFIGVSLRKGKTLYTEIWDNKGPLLFFIQEVGTVGGTKNSSLSGIFILQVFSVFVSFILMRIADIKLNSPDAGKLRFFIISACTCMILGLTLEGGNNCEEWCLPFICCSLALMTSYIVTASQKPGHPAKYAFIYGICFGLIAFIRVNNAAPICAGAIVIGIYLICKKQWKNLFTNILFGIAGILIAALPFLLYFYKKQALSDMIYAVFLYNLKYISQKTHSSFNGIELLLRFMPMIASLVLILINMIQSHRCRLTDIFFITITAGNLLLLAENNIYFHYFIITIPVIMLIFLTYIKPKNMPALLISICLSGFFIYELVLFIPNLRQFHEAEPRYLSTDYIPKDEKTSMIAIWTPPDIYLNTGFEPCSRYCAYQKIHFSVDPEMKNEFISDIEEKQPKWILKPCYEEGMYPEIEKSLAETYTLQFSERDICYFRRGND